MKAELNDDEILKLAYRTVYSQLNEPIGLVSKTIPKTPNQEHINGLQLKALIEEYDTEIKLFKDILAGKIKPRIIVIEPDTDHISVSKAKRLKQEHQKDIETIRQGLSILEKRRRPYAHKLLFTKIRQFQITGIISESQQLNQEASKIKKQIEEHRTKIKSAIKRFYDLQSRFNELHKKFNNTNLDPEKTNALTFTEQLPTTVLNFVKN